MARYRASALKAKTSFPMDDSPGKVKGRSLMISSEIKTFRFLILEVRNKMHIH
jgi:hypothetical protein